MKLRLTTAVWGLCIVFALSGAACTDPTSGTPGAVSSPLAVGGGSLSSDTATSVASPTTTRAPTTAPTPAPTPKPTPKPATPASVVATSAPPPPAANTCGAPSNPWGYNFCGGNYIYSPPGNFCNYFSCIPSFWKSTNGYVEQCMDRMFSHSGGRQGSCSSHGGNQRPLYGP
jgi:hypothetical protein